MGKKSKRKDKDKLVSLNKTINDKQLEIVTIKNKIESFGLGEGNDDIKLFYKELDKFINGDFTIEGFIPLHGHQRKIKYLLPQKKINKCQISLVYDKNI